MVSWCGHEELCINHSSLQLSVSSHTANAHWEWGDVSSSHTSRCRELSPPTAMGTLIICSCWIGKLHYSVPGNVLSTIMTAVWIVRPGWWWECPGAGCWLVTGVDRSGCQHKGHCSCHQQPQGSTSHTACRNDVPQCPLYMTYFILCTYFSAFI